MYFEFRSRNAVERERERFENQKIKVKKSDLCVWNKECVAHTHTHTHTVRVTTVM